MNIEFIKIDESNYRVCDAPFETSQSRYIVPHVAQDGNTPDGMRKARWTGVWEPLSESWVGGSWVDEEAVQLAALFAVQHENGCLNTIDTAAGRARLRFVSGGWGIEEEYRRAEQESRAFAAAGYPADAIPLAVQAEIRDGIVAQQAADTIIAKADVLYSALDTIRAARLSGKAAVKAAATDAEKSAASATAVDSLDVINPTLTGS